MGKLVEFVILAIQLKLDLILTSELYTEAGNNQTKDFCLKVNAILFFLNI